MLSEMLLGLKGKFTNHPHMDCLLLCQAVTCRNWTPGFLVSEMGILQKREKRPPDSLRRSLGTTQTLRQTGTHTHMHVYTYVHRHTHRNTLAHACIYTYIHMCTCVYTHAHVCACLYTHAHMSIHLHIYMAHAHSGISPAKHSPSWELKACNEPKSGSFSHRHPSFSSSGGR